MLARRVVRLASTGSTMADAARLAAEGAPHGTMVIAAEQTAGQGRHGHSWHSEAGLGLYLSLVLRPDFAPETTPGLTLAVGLAVRRALLEVTGLACDLRWPNDLMLGGRKCGGILLQLEHSGGPRGTARPPGNASAIAGIGINVNHRAFPPELVAEATSLRIQSGREWLVEPLGEVVADAVDQACSAMARGGLAPVLAEFERVSSYARGLAVTVDQPGGMVRGVTAGLDPLGFLRVMRADGGIVLVTAGGVRPV